MSTNGLLSFREAFNEFRVTAFPRISSDTVPIIAPLWADYNFRERGNVYYRVTEDTTTLIRAKELITEYQNGFDEFSPSLCVIVSWVDAALLTRSSNENVVRPLLFPEM